MAYQLPHTIKNCNGELLTFKELIKEADGDRLLVENSVKPGCGPVMHTHLLQDESLTVIRGKMAYQIQGQAPQYAGEGETVLFTRGTPHRFWNAGTDVLQCTGWVKPANTIIFFLSSVYAAQNKTGSERPEQFDGAYLMTRYASEYDLVEVPLFVKKVVLPATYYLGQLLGKYKHFAHAPEPVKG
jgi:quercetin dioxygenase-like cupin family protein